VGQRQRRRISDSAVLPSLSPPMPAAHMRYYEEGGIAGRRHAKPPPKREGSIYILPHALFRRHILMLCRPSSHVISSMRKHADLHQRFPPYFSTRHSTTTPYHAHYFTASRGSAEASDGAEGQRGSGRQRARWRQADGALLPTLPPPSASSIFAFVPEGEVARREA